MCSSVLKGPGTKTLTSSKTRYAKFTVYTYGERSECARYRVVHIRVLIARCDDSPSLCRESKQRVVTAHSYTSYTPSPGYRNIRENFLIELAYLSVFAFVTRGERAAR